MKKNILVTGSHRSGTTWVGRIISESYNVKYVHEPFNIDLHKKKSPIKNWYEYVNHHTNNNHTKEIENYIKSFYSLPYEAFYHHFKKIKSRKDINLLILKSIKKYRYRYLIKDPIALLSSEWFFHKLNFDIVISIRHPASFISSLMKNNWQFDFGNFYNQKKLLKNKLSGYENEILEFAKHEKELIDQGILLYNTLFSVIRDFRDKYSNEWLFIKNEDLSKDPIEKYQDIFDFLKLDFTDSIKKTVLDSTSSLSNPTISRNSKKNINVWKDRLNENQISYIKEGTSDVWKHFYTNEDW